MSFLNGTLQNSFVAICQHFEYHVVDARVTEAKADEMHLLGCLDSDVVMFVWSIDSKRKSHLKLLASREKLKILLKD